MAEKFDATELLLLKASVGRYTDQSLVEEVSWADGSQEQLAVSMRLSQLRALKEKLVRMEKEAFEAATEKKEG